MDIVSIDTQIVGNLNELNEKVYDLEVEAQEVKTYVKQLEDKIHKLTMRINNVLEQLD